MEGKSPVLALNDVGCFIRHEPVGPEACRYANGRAKRRGYLAGAGAGIDAASGVALAAGTMATRELRARPR